MEGKIDMMEEMQRWIMETLNQIPVHDGHTLVASAARIPSFVPFDPMSDFEGLTGQIQHIHGANSIPNEKIPNSS